jgi:hypothetical protein
VSFTHHKPNKAINIRVVPNIRKITYSRTLQTRVLEWDYYQTNHHPLRVHHQTRSLWRFDHQIKRRVLPLQTVSESLWLIQTVDWERRWNQTVHPVRVHHQNQTRAPVPAVQKVTELVVVVVVQTVQQVRVAQMAMTLRVVAVQTQSVVQTAMALAAAAVAAVQSHHHQTRMERALGYQREEPVLQKRRAPCWYFAAAADQNLRSRFVERRTL